jgi:hypothetical protein
VAKTICLTVSVLLEALALAELVLVVELELELEHPAVATRPAATTVTLSQVAVRRLIMFTNDLYAIRVTPGTAEFNAQVNDPWREDVRLYKSAQRSARFTCGQRVARVVDAPDGAIQRGTAVADLLRGE